MAFSTFKILLFTLMFYLNIGYSNGLNKTYDFSNKDSIFFYLKFSKDKTLPIKKRLSFVNSIYNYSINSKNDSIKSEALKLYINLYYKQKEWRLFNKFRLEHIQLSKKHNDSKSLAKTFEYSAYYHKINHRVDSTYYYYFKSFKIYEKENDSLKAGKVLISIAIFQKNTHDYIGSEETSFKALNFLKLSQNLRQISSINNNLGLVYEQLNDFDNSKKYHTKALNLRKEIKNPIYKIHSLNNLGILHTRFKKYSKALFYFREAIKFKDVLESKKLLKAYIIDNYTYARFKNGKKKDVLKFFNETLNIREKENHLEGIIINCIHLAEYYNEIGKQKKSLLFAKRAEEISKSIEDYHDYLISIELLSSLQENSKSKDIHFKKYILIRDSLDNVARNHKEQFARIRFETDEKDFTIESQKDVINRNSTKILLVILGSVFIFSIILFSFIYRRMVQKKLKKELMNGFKSYLMNKYSLSNQNFEFWEILTTGVNQNKISEKLFISIEAIKSRRRSLKNKITKIEKIDGNFDKTKAVILYNKELELYKKHIPNKEK